MATPTTLPTGHRSLIDDTLIELAAWHLIDAAPDATIIADERGTIVVANPGAVAMFGYERDELLGQPVEMLVPAPKRESHQRDRTAFQANPHSRPMGVGLELVARRADGSDVPVEVSLSPLEVHGRHLTIASVRDISPRLAMEAERRRVRRALDAARDGVALFDVASLRLVYVNQGIVAQTGHGADELLRRTVVDLDSSWDEDTVRRFLQPLVDRVETARTVTARLRHARGDELPVEIVVQRPDTHGDEPDLFVAIMRDISERLRNAEELQQTHDRLVLAEERERIARDLHDTVIQRIFAVGLRLQTAATMAPGAVRDRIVDVVDDLDVTIRELRTAVFQLGSPPQHQRGVRGQILTVASEAARVLGFEPHVRFEGVIEDRVSPAVLEHLLPTMREALTNIARHAEASTVSIDVRTGPDLLLRIEDDGRGLHPDRIPGNGLANMTERAKTLGGRCEVTSAPGTGTTVVWQVPL